LASMPLQGETSASNYTKRNGIVWCCSRLLPSEQPAYKREISEMLMKKRLARVLVAATIGATLAATATDASAQWGRRGGRGWGWRGPGVGAGIAAGVVGGAIVAGAILASVWSRCRLYRATGTNLSWLCGGPAASTAAGRLCSAAPSYAATEVTRIS
jgi:hypothetical protein